MVRTQLAFGKTRLLEIGQQRKLEDILLEYFDEQNAPEEQLMEDYKDLKQINEEIHHIQQQSILMHGERIKKAHQILSHYRTGAFHAWAIAVYGNRQTPYSLLQYYEFYKQLPSEELKDKLDRIPRKIAYMIAARQIELEERVKFLASLDEKKKQQTLLIEVRDALCDTKSSAKHRSVDDTLLHDLKKYVLLIDGRKNALSPKIKRELAKLGEKIAEISQ